MKKLQIALILLLFLFMPVFLSAQNENFDAEYLKLKKEYTLNEDGSYDFHLRKEIKLNTHFAFHRLFGETFIVYNPQFQALKINECFTVMADGRKVVAPENAFNEVLPGFARDIAAYNHLREMVVTHTGLEVGSVITLDYTITTKAGFLPFFFGSEEIGDIVPVDDLEIIVKVPQNTELKHRMLNNRTAPAVTEADGKKIYTWGMRNIQALPHSASQDIGGKAMLFFTTAGDMTRAYYAFVDQESFKSKPGDAISKRVDAAVKDKNNDLDIILDMQAIVIDEVKTAGIPMEYSGYKARTPDVMWQSANATTLEKAILLAEMLKLANISAFPVASVPDAWYSSDMGNLAVIDDYLVQVNPKETGRIYLSVTGKQAQNLIYNLDDKTLIQLDAAIESMRTFREEAVEHELEMEGELRFEDLGIGGFGDLGIGGSGDLGIGGSGDLGIGGELELELSGICNPYYRLRKDSSYVKNMIAGDLPSSSIKNIETEKLTELKSNIILNLEPGIWNLESGNLSEKGFHFFELPRFKTGFDAWNLEQFLGSGDTPVRLDYILEEDYEFEVSLPSGWALFTPPMEIDIKNDLGELIISISQSGSKVKVERSFELYKDVISSDLMDEFKEMILAWVKDDYRKIVIKKNQ